MSGLRSAAGVIMRKGPARSQQSNQPYMDTKRGACAFGLRAVAQKRGDDPAWQALYIWTAPSTSIRALSSGALGKAWLV